MGFRTGLWLHPRRRWHLCRGFQAEKGWADVNTAFIINIPSYWEPRWPQYFFSVFCWKKMRGEEPTNIFLHRSNLMGSTPGGFKSRVAGRCVQWLMCLEGAFWLMEVPPQLLCFDLVLEFKCWRVWAASLASELCFPTLQNKTVQGWLVCDYVLKNNLYYVNLIQTPKSSKVHLPLPQPKMSTIQANKRRNAMPGHPVDVVEGRRISFIPGFQDTDESCEAQCHAPWGLSEFANLMISRFVFVCFFSGGSWLAHCSC